ncbi:hypothetical protein VAS14_17491 [Photobacterium angustum S14]|uniref:Uncharacterized protein n=2 Tax=Photobacterium angustum TaxID=661 RepID=Q1ZP90_PHOAS|nr:hypothetical protein VAS14_17491 [Photobacterium angustum S14]
MESAQICMDLTTSPIYDPLFWSSMLSTFASIATIIAAVLAIFAVKIAVKQIRLSKTQSAISLYQQYLELCTQYPRFARGMNKPIKRNCNQYEQYLWFVASMLHCFEQVVLSVGDDPQWQNTIKSQLKKHIKAISVSGSLSRDEWEKSLLVLIKEVTNQE